MKKGVFISTEQTIKMIFERNPEEHKQYTKKKF